MMNESIIFVFLDYVITFLLIYMYVTLTIISILALLLHSELSYRLPFLIRFPYQSLGGMFTISHVRSKVLSLTHH